MLVNSAFAKLFFPGTSAIGKRVRLNPEVSPDAPWMEIAGVIGDTRQFGMESSVQPEMYIPLAIYPAAGVSPAVIIRTADNPKLHLKDIQNSVRQADPEIPVFSMRTMEQVEARKLGYGRSTRHSSPGLLLWPWCWPLAAFLPWSRIRCPSELLKLECEWRAAPHKAM